MPGVYLFLDRKGHVLYAGKANNLKERVASYFIQRNLLPKTRMLVSLVRKIRVVPVEGEIESLLLEANFIKKYQPKYNSRLTDGKAYPLIEVTKNNGIPKVLTVRKGQNPTSMYFGPFPNGKAVLTVLRTLRKIFPFQSVRNHPKRFCLYYHLRLCPCPPMLTSKELKLYRINIRRLSLFLAGKTAKVIKDLEKERNLRSQQNDFERAQELQSKIDAIRYVTSRFHKPFEYETNPNLRSDLRKRELVKLQALLRKCGYLTDTLTRIEAYDISNVHGKQAVGSMVVAVEAEFDKSQYKRFKIRTKNTPDDTAMLREVLTRRLTHREWGSSDLFLIDGGKPQVNAVCSVLEKQRLRTPVIGLAKRFEEIVIAGKTFRMASDSPVLQLLQRIRDEAHRFAVSYHRKLRSRAIFD